MQKQLLILSASVLLFGRGQSHSEIVFGRQQYLPSASYLAEDIHYFPAGTEFQLTVESLSDCDASRNVLEDELTVR